MGIARHYWPGWSAAALFVLLGHLTAVAGSDFAWQQHAEEVLNRLWSAVEVPQPGVSRPQVRVLADDALNAHIRVMDGDPGDGRLAAELLICRGLAERLLVREDRQPDLDALAGVMGHELAHLLLGHCSAQVRQERERARQQDAVIGASATREDEFAADLYGAKLAARAGYDPHGLIRAFERGRALLGEDGCWETCGADHPTFTQRLEVLDQERAELWRSALDFEVGVDMLRAGNHACAQECFRSALASFPESPEVLCNLGYALLMDYHHRLPPEYWIAHDVGQPLPVGFATYLPVPPRRSRSAQEWERLRRQWQEAVGYLQQAVRVEPGHALALGNLGFAYLIAPEGPQVDQAATHLQQVSSDSVPPGLVRSVTNNLALVAVLQGRREEAMSLLEAEASRKDEPRPAFPNAPVVNLCLLRADSPRGEDQQRAAADLERLLPSYPATSAQWQYAYDKYVALCGRLGRRPLPPARLSAPSPDRVQPYFVWRGVNIYLGDSPARLWRLLGKPDAAVPVASRTAASQTTVPSAAAMSCWRYLAGGLELTFLRSTLVRARVSGSTDGAPCEVVISRAGMNTPVRIGDPAARLDEVLRATYDDAIRLGDARPYRLYSAARLAALVESGTIRALAMVN